LLCSQKERVQGGVKEGGVHAVALGLLGLLGIE
jgi:hypothetical protein